VWFYFTSFGILNKGGEDCRHKLRGRIIDQVVGKKFVFSWKRQNLRKEVEFFDNRMVVKERPYKMVVVKKRPYKITKPAQ